MIEATAVKVGDVLEMKKQHPCGSKTWAVLRTGVDFRLRCCGCGHEVMRPRAAVLKNVKKVVKEGGADAGK